MHLSMDSDIHQEITTTGTRQFAVNGLGWSSVKSSKLNECNESTEFGSQMLN